MEKTKTFFAPIGDKDLLSKKVANAIEEAIKLRHFKVGEKLPSEMELCSQFEVSRTSIREALRSLAAKGFIFIHKGKGIYVKNISIDSVVDPLKAYLQLKSDVNPVREVVQARKIIEPAIAEFAAVNHSDEDVQRLYKDLEDLKNANGDYEELAKIDLKFHLDIARASKNNLMALVLDPIHKLLPTIGSYVYETVHDAKKSALIWHEKILKAIISKDPKKAAQAMREHMLNAEKHAEMMLKKKTEKKK